MKIKHKIVFYVADLQTPLDRMSAIEEQQKPSVAALKKNSEFTIQDASSQDAPEESRTERGHFMVCHHNASSSDW